MQKHFTHASFNNFLPGWLHPLYPEFALTFYMPQQSAQLLQIFSQIAKNDIKSNTIYHDIVFKIT